MEEKRSRFQECGLVCLSKEELQMRGGISPEGMRRLAEWLGIIINFASDYGKDFLKGFKKGYNGQPLFSLSKATARR